jgi:hypothetical protein
MRGRPPSTPPDALTENLGIERLQNFCFLGKRQCADQVCRTLANDSRASGAKAPPGLIPTASASAWNSFLTRLKRRSAELCRTRQCVRLQPW